MLCRQWDVIGDDSLGLLRQIPILSDFTRNDWFYLKCKQQNELNRRIEKE